jgi:hypothetical protein
LFLFFLKISSKLEYKDNDVVELSQFELMPADVSFLWYVFVHNFNSTFVCFVLDYEHTIKLFDPQGHYQFEVNQFNNEEVGGSKCRYCFVDHK